MTTRTPWPAPTPPLTPAEVSKRHNRRIVIGIVAGAVLFFGLVVVGTVTKQRSTHSFPGSSAHSVTYRVSGSSGKGDLTYQTPSGTGQQSGIDLPFSIDYQMASGAFVYVSVQNDEDFGGVSCSIVMDGRVVASNTSQGGFAIATCDGRLP